MIPMLLIDNRHADVCFNLAAEEFLLKNVVEDVVMLWRSDPAVVIGKHQEVRVETDPVAMAREGIRVVRRYTGGGAVFHDRGNLNLSFFETGPKIDFSRFVELIRNFLSSLGVDTVVDERNGLFVGGRKVSGSAQCIYRDRVLFHATLLFRTDLEMLERALRPEVRSEEPPTRPKTKIGSVRSPVANLDGLIVEAMEPEEFVDRVRRYFETVYPGIRPYVFSPEETEAIRKLRLSRYATDAWNLGK